MSNDIKERIEKLSIEITAHNHFYYTEEGSTIPDAEYDERFRELCSLADKWPQYVPDKCPSRTIGSPVSSDVPKVHYETKMLSLDNVFDDQEFMDWVVENGLEKEALMAEPKYDGLALRLQYDIDGNLIMASTRGTGLIGGDVTDRVAAIPGIPMKLRGKQPIMEGKPLIVDGEVLMPTEAFDALNEELCGKGEDPYSNPRNAAAGSLRLSDNRELLNRKLKFYAYRTDVPGVPTHAEELELLQYAGFKVSKLVMLFGKISGCLEYRARLNDTRGTLPYEIDGVVFKANDKVVQRKLGNTRRAPRHAIAYKFPAEEQLTAITSIDYQVGRTGVITPVANLHSVYICGVVVSNATLHNFNELQRLDLHHGDTVIVRRAGDVIPQVTAVVLDRRLPGARPFKLPNACPDCGTGLEQRVGEVAVRCPDKWDCPGQAKAMYEHFVSRPAMNIDGMADGTIKKLIDARMLRDAASIFTLDVAKLIKLPGFALKSAYKLEQAILASRKTTLARVIFALGIPGVGEDTATRLANSLLTLEAFITVSVPDLLQIDGVGDDTAHSVMAWCAEAKNINLVGKLIKLLDIERIIAIDRSTLPFNELTFVITGSFDNFTRSTAKEHIVVRGGKVSGTVSKKTDYLVLGTGGGEKEAKANRLNEKGDGPKIITEKELIAMG